MKFKKLISSSLAIGFLFNNTSASLASVLSEDGRYETFEGNNITISNVLEEGAVDIEIEGNTMINVANQKDPVPTTKKYTVEKSNHIPLQGDYDGKAKAVVEGNTIYYNNDTNELSDTFIEGANLSLISSFEDQLITQEMVDSGIEKAENLGKYKVEYKSVGKNLIDTKRYQTGRINTSTGEVIPDINGRNTDFFRLNKNKDVWCYSPYKENWTHIFYYDKDKKYIGCDVGIKNRKLNAIPDNCVYARLVTYYEESENVVLSYDSLATGYEPYKESIRTFYLNYPLLKGDTIEEIDGEVYHVRRWQKRTLNGSETWYKGHHKSSFYMFDSDVGGDNDEINNICSDFVSVHNNGMDSDDINGTISTGLKLSVGNITINIETSWLTENTVKGFREWLAENPVDVIYRLLEPKYEKISENNLIISSYNNGYLDFNTDIPVSKVEFLPFKEELRYLYPNTEYTVQFESDNKGKIDRVLLGDEVLYSNFLVNKGINKFNIVTPSTILSTELTLDGVGFNLYNLVITQATDENFGYFEGIKSVGQNDKGGHKIGVLSENKNLYSYEKMLQNTQFVTKINNTSIKVERQNPPEYSYHSQEITDYLIDGKSYTLSADMSNTELGNYGVDVIRKSDNYRELVNARTFVVDTSKYFYRLKFYSNKNPNRVDGLCSVIYSNIQLEYGDVATNAVESKFNKIEMSLSEPLRSLPNGVKDKIIKRNGQWVVERNCAESIVDGSENNWYLWKDDYLNTISFAFPSDSKNEKETTSNDSKNTLCDKFVEETKYTDKEWHMTHKYLGVKWWAINISRDKLVTQDVDGFKQWIQENPIKMIYQLDKPIYEPLNTDPVINTYLDVTHISNNSVIPANMRVTVDRTLNKVTEYIELAKINPTTENLSRARYWINLLKESTKKDQLQSEINSITNIDDLQLERKSASSNLDVYVKSQNMLSMSLNTNSVTFDGYSGTEDMEMLGAVNISINSSLPYDLNAYISGEISNGDKSETMPIDILNIKESSEGVYQRFDNTTDKVVLKDSCNAGNNKMHDIDLKLASNLAHKADVYKTVIKFEAEQK